MTQDLTTVQMRHFGDQQTSLRELRHCYTHSRLLFIRSYANSLIYLQRVQRKFRGMRNGAQTGGGVRDMRDIESGIQDENIGMRSFQLVGCGIVLKLIAGCGI